MSPHVDLSDIYADVAAKARAFVMAQRGGRSLVNQRARHLSRPRNAWQLDAIEPGLSRLDPHRMVLRAEAAVERASRPSERAQIIPVTLVNARAALLLARWERRCEQVSHITLEAAE